jgi:hypothetical protein
MTAAAVTAALGIQPTYSHEVGDPVSSATLAVRGRRTRQAVWSFEEQESVTTEGDPHGMRSLDRLAQRFEPKSQILAALAADYGIRVSMFAHSDSTQGGFVIAPETMRRIGLLSAEFFGTVWIDEESILVDPDAERRP